MIIPAIIGGIASGAAVGTVSGLLGWGLKQAEEANKTPDKPDKVWRIQAGRGFNEFPNKEYDLYKSLLSSKIDGGWDWGNAARHYWVKGGQWNKLEVDMKDAVGTYKLSGLRNYTGGDLDVNMQKPLCVWVNSMAILSQALRIALIAPREWISTLKIS
ncbi:hypothetical protein HpHA244_07720 [Helicobacter pylori]